DQNERCGVIHLQSEGLKMLISKIVIERYGKTVYDEASKHVLIYIESLNKGDNQGISPVHIEISGIFVIGCHCAVGSGISTTNLLMQLTDSVFIEPSCYSNMIYLNRTLGTIDDCVFSGRNGTYQDFNLLNVFEQVSEEVLYISEGDYSISSVIFNETKVFGVRVDKGTVLLNKINFIEADILEGDYYDESLLLVQCVGNSKVDIKEVIVNGRNKYNYGECESYISDLWEMREMPNTSLNKANIKCECLRYRRTIEVCDFRRQDDSKIIFGYDC
ncbi:MAG: hypothetical protein EZS28_036079, partial [Streblomastix strix]